VGVVAMAATERINLPGVGSTTAITSVATSHGTFRAAIDIHRGDHRGEMRSVFHTNTGEQLEVVTAPNKRLFSPRAELKAVGAGGAETTVQLDKDLFHVGKVVGESGSHVHLSVHHSGGIDGVLRRADGTKLVLSALQRYSGVNAPSYHDTVVYRADDMTDEALAGLRGHAEATCSAAAHFNRTRIEGYNSSGRAAFEASFIERKASTLDRKRRDTPQHCDDSMGGRCSCSVALLGDHFFFAGPHAQQNTRYGIQHMVNVLVEADKIYRDTDFGGIDNIGFVVHSAIIYTSSGGGNPTPGSNYADGSTFLNAVTNGLRDRYIDACTSMLFTHRDFQEGILGMAWVAEPSGYGGICDPMFNCGFNTGINFGQIVTPFVASLVFAHETGHQFGSEHDPDATTCSPGNDDGGNYIMYAAASDGAYPNNNQFSTCSKAQMSNILSLVREGCFVEAGVGCGDGEVSGDEECDCGNECTPTSCCTSDCRVNRQLYQCSPQNPIRFPCCTLQCMYASAGTKCHSEDACGDDSYCSGTNSSCPIDAKADDTPCHCSDGDCDANPDSNPQVCDSGVCHKFVCQLYGAVQCGLSHPHSCELGCRGDGWGDGSECVSTFDSSKTPDGFNGGRLYVPGTPCRKNLGRCDKSGMCVTVATDDGRRAARDRATEFVAHNWMAITGGVGGTLILLLVALHYRQHRITVHKCRESERAYLLAAANAEAEACEEQLVFGSSDVDNSPSPDYAVPEYAVPVDGPLSPLAAQRQNYMEGRDSSA